MWKWGGISIKWGGLSILSLLGNATGFDSLSRRHRSWIIIVHVRVNKIDNVRDRAASKLVILNSYVFQWQKLTLTCVHTLVVRVVVSSDWRDFQHETGDLYLLPTHIIVLVCQPWLMHRNGRCEIISSNSTHCIIIIIITGVRRTRKLSGRLVQCIKTFSHNSTILSVNIDML